MERSVNKILLCLGIFAVAMAFMESAVVIYLRELYYREGFAFPLRPMPAGIATVEVLREAATIIMLVAAGFLAGKNRLQRFAFFSIAFAVWDLFYYLFLYLFLGWPESLFTWDILFLIPFPWVGPVWAPCLLCLLMIVGSVFVVIQTERNGDFRIPLTHWMLLIVGAAVCILAFMWDYLLYRKKLWTPASDKDLFAEIEGYVPTTFNHPLFFLGFSLMCLPVFYNIFRSRALKPTGP